MLNSMLEQRFLKINNTYFYSSKFMKYQLFCTSELQYQCQLYTLANSHLCPRLHLENRCKSIQITTYVQLHMVSFPLLLVIYYYLYGLLNSPPAYAYWANPSGFALRQAHMSRIFDGCQALDIKNNNNRYKLRSLTLRKSPRQMNLTSSKTR